jgi:hypothetical protein
MIMFGSFLPSLWSSTTKVYPGLRSRHCYEIKWILPRRGILKKGWQA